MSFEQADGVKNSSPSIIVPPIVVVEPDSPQRLYLAGLFGGVNNAAYLKDIPFNGPFVLVLGPSLAADDRALAEAETVLISHSDVAAILITPGESVPPDKMKWGLRANVKDVVPYEGPADDIRSAADRALQILQNTLQQNSAMVLASQAREASQEGKVIVVFSPKGGVGKSTLASNLSVQLSLLAPDMTIALVDANLQFGDISIMLRIAGQQNVATIMESKDRINPHTYGYACAVHERSGLRVLTAPADPSYADTVPAENIVDVMNAIRGFAAYTVIDTAPILNELNILILEHADHILIPVNPDLPSMKNVAVILKTLRALGIREGQIGIVLNKASAKNSSEKKEVERTLDYKVVSVIPEDAAVSAAINDGQPFVLASPKAPCSHSIMELATLFFPERKPQKSTKGLLRKR